MSTSSLVRQLFRGLESTINERMNMIETLLEKGDHSIDMGAASSAGTIESSVKVTRLDPEVMERVKKLEDRMDDFKKMDARMAETQKDIGNVASRYSRVDYAILHMTDTIEKLRVQVAELQKKVEVLQASHVATQPTSEEVQQEIAHREVVSAPELAEAEAAEVEEEEEEEFEEQVIEEADMADDEEEAEEEVEEEEVEEEEVEEEEAEELTEFVYRKQTYYRDSENMCYQLDEDGNLIDTPIGVWNATTNRIHPLKQ